MSTRLEEKLANYLDEAIAQIDHFWRGTPTPERWFSGETRAQFIEAIKITRKQQGMDSPDLLLAAAHSALKLLRGSGFTENTGAIMELRAAIAKAESL